MTAASRSRKACRRAPTLTVPTITVGETLGSANREELSRLWGVRVSKTSDQADPAYPSGMHYLNVTRYSSRSPLKLSGASQATVMLLGTQDRGNKKPGPADLTAHDGLHKASLPILCDTRGHKIANGLWCCCICLHCARDHCRATGEARKRHQLERAQHLSTRDYRPRHTQGRTTVDGTTPPRDTERRPRVP